MWTSLQRHGRHCQAVLASKLPSLHPGGPEPIKKGRCGLALKDREALV
jgi:hypothetical protein